jgi:hypothetical protein
LRRHGTNIKILRNYTSLYLLCFKLTLASPVERDITAPKANIDEKGVDFDGGATGNKESVLKVAIRTNATA